MSNALKIIQRKHTFKITGVLALAAAGFALWFMLAAKPQLDFRFHWQEGKEYVYHLKYTSQNSVNLGLKDDATRPEQQTFSGGIDIDSTLSIKCYERNGQQFLLGVALKDSTKLAFDVMGAPLYGSTALAKGLFDGQQAFVRVHGDGTIAELSFTDQTPEAVRTTLQTILGDTQIIVQNHKNTWHTEEDTIHGRASNNYEAQVKSASIELSKQRLNYIRLNALPAQIASDTPKVEGWATAQLDPDGYLMKLEGHESIHVENDHSQTMLAAQSRVELTFQEIRDFAPQNLAGLLAQLRARGLGEIVVSEAAEKKALKQRAGGMTVEKMVADLMENRLTGDMPFHSRWVWRATGLLRLEPKAAWELVDVFTDPRLSDTARKGVLELLASAGGDEAEKVLRHLLETETAQSSGHYGRMVQRIAGLDAPTLETVDYVKKKMTDAAGSDENLHHASSYALGRLTRSLRESGNENEAAQYNQHLLDNLENASSSKDTIVYLRSVGLVREPENVPAMIEFSTSPNDDVRAALAFSLKALQTADSENTILALAKDPAANVQKRALRTMKTYQLDESHLNEINESFEADKFDQKSFGPLMTMLASNYKKNPEATDAARVGLEKMLEKDLGAKMRYQIRTLLQRQPQNQ